MITRDGFRKKGNEKRSWEGKKDPMEIGISTACLYPMTTELALKTLLEAGFRLFELFFNSYSEINPGYVRELKRQADAYEAKIVSIHPFTSGFETMLLFSDYERRYTDALDFYQEYFEAAAILGAKILVLHGERDYWRKRITEEVYLERYAGLRKKGKIYGVDVAQENVNAFRSEDPAFLCRMREKLHGDCSFVYDVKQAVRAGYDAYEVCNAMGDRIVHVHLNDNFGKEKDCLLPGKGQMDYMRLGEQLAAQNYQGDAVIEVYRGDFSEIEELVAAQRFSQTLVSGFFSQKA